MERKRILYISGSVGLGHITRDLAIAKELRTQNPAVEISWLAVDPATLLLKDLGEELLPEADLYANDNIAVENAAKGFQLNLLKYLSKAKGEWMHNVEVFKQVISKEQFDLIIGDEAYEIGIALMDKRVQIEAPVVEIYDFLGNNSVTKNPVEKCLTYMWNRVWAKIRQFFSNGTNLALFVGELEDIPDESLGFLLPNRRELAKEVFKFVGYVLPFDPAEYANTAKTRAKLGYGEEPLVVCSIGGTSIGKDLLELCVQAHPMIKNKVRDLHMILVCGPRLSTKSLRIPEGIDIRGYVPNLYEHFAASDLVIVMGGGTSTLELTALRRPFLYFPLEQHFEQQVHVAARLARHKAGVRMSYHETTAEALAKKVVANLGESVDYASIPTDGAQKAAGLINQLLSK